MAAHLASKRPKPIFISRNSSTSDGLRRLLTGQAFRSYSTGLCVRASVGGASEKRTLFRPRYEELSPLLSVSDEHSDCDLDPTWAEARLRKQGRRGIFGFDLPGEDDLRLRDDLRTSCGD